jgi:hypothetical protein
VDAGIEIVSSDSFIVEKEELEGLGSLLDAGRPILLWRSEDFRSDG